MTDIEVSLAGDHGRIGAHQLKDALTAIISLLDEAAVEKVEWRVGRLSEGSLHLGLAASTADEAAQHAVDIVSTGPNSLQRQALVPPASATRWFVRQADLEPSRVPVGWTA